MGRGSKKSLWVTQLRVKDGDSFLSKKILPVSASEVEDGKPWIVLMRTSTGPLGLMGGLDAGWLDSVYRVAHRLLELDKISCVRI